MRLENLLAQFFQLRIIADRIGVSDILNAPYGTRNLTTIGYVITYCLNKIRRTIPEEYSDE